MIAMAFGKPFGTILLASLLVSALFGAPRPTTGRYVLILADTPAAGGNTLDMAEKATRLRRVQTAQNGLRQTLDQRNILVTGSAQVLLNAMFVMASPDREAELRSLPGVTSVIPVRRYYSNLNAAVQLVNAPAAWNALGGLPNAGTGIKIAIIDSGIDQNHPAFRNLNVALPSGYPICAGADCAYTNKKVIVARSYVNTLAAGTQPNPAVDSRPDDLLPRDHVGHGTALAMVAAGGTNTGPSATITGMASQAWLGNYKIFGSPGVNDFATTDGIVMALEDAVKDGMNIAVLSLGSPAFSGPLDTGAACGNNAGDPCDPEAIAIENASKLGLLVVAAGGNEGDTGSGTTPAFNTVDSPGHAPSAISVAATTNSHVWAESFHVPGSDAPSNLQTLPGNTGDSLVTGPITAPMRDVTRTGDNGQACRAMPAGSLNGTIALLVRGTCTYATKVLNAQAAGAAGTVIYDNAAEALFSPTGLNAANIPSILIGNTDGLALKSFLASHLEHAGSIDPTPLELAASVFNTTASFSSRGPSTGNSAIKPDLAAVGTSMYMATQSYDPLGAMYSASGYVVADGTSFSTPMAAGAAALVKQRNPQFTPAQLKSALMNTATSDVTGASGLERVTGVGAGKVDANAALATNVTVEPASVSFGALNSPSVPVTLPAIRTLLITNTSKGNLSLQLTVVARDSDAKAQVKLGQTSVSLAAGQAGTVTVQLTGSLSSPGSYEGVITITGGAVPLHVPYEYFVGDGVSADMIILSGDSFSGTVGQDIPDGVVSFKLVDRYGLPVASAPVRFRVSTGTGTVRNADSQTDRYGIAAAEFILGPEVNQALTATGGGFSYRYTGFARPLPVISAGGIVNAASFDTNPLAPGALASIFGTGLSDSTDAATALPLPLNIDLVNVSFDVPSAGISVPGRVYYVSPNQINVLIPWELQGQTSALVKVRIEETFGAVYTLALAQYSPALFGAALDQTGKLVTAANPAVRGQTIQLFANGLGAVSNTPATGDAAPSAPLSQTTTTPTVTIGGAPGLVSFSGLAPGFAGLYQVNVVVPSSIAAGAQTVALSIGGLSSKTTFALNVK